MIPRGYTGSRPRSLGLSVYHLQSLGWLIERTSLHVFHVAREPSQRLQIRPCGVPRTKTRSRGRGRMIRPLGCSWSRRRSGPLPRRALAKNVERVKADVARRWRRRNTRGVRGRKFVGAGHGLDDAPVAWVKTRGATAVVRRIA